MNPKLQLCYGACSYAVTYATEEKRNLTKDKLDCPSPFGEVTNTSWQLIASLNYSGFDFVTQNQKENSEVYYCFKNECNEKLKEKVLANLKQTPSPRPDPDDVISTTFETLHDEGDTELPSHLHQNTTSPNDSSLTERKNFFLYFIVFLTLFN